MSEVTVSAREPSRRTRCPYCHDLLGADEPARTCPGCEAGLHPECWEEIGGCPACQAPRARAALFEPEQVPDYARRVRVTPRADGPRQVLLSPFDAEQAPAYALPRTQEQRDAELGLELLRYVGFGIVCVGGGVLALLFLVALMAGAAFLSGALPF